MCLGSLFSLDFPGLLLSLGLLLCFLSLFFLFLLFLLLVDFNLLIRFLHELELLEVFDALLGLLSKLLLGLFVVETTVFVESKLLFCPAYDELVAQNPVLP